MTKNYTTKSASIKATNIDTYRIDAKMITINGEPLKSAIVIKDERETITENDIWPNPINADVEHLTSNTDGNIVYQGLTNNTFDYSEMSTAHKNITKTATKVIDNKVLGSNDELLMNWDTKSFTNSGNSSMISIFDGDGDITPPITEWNSDLSKLTNGNMMFLYCTNLASFNSDLSSLTDAYDMFYGTNLESFNSDLSNLTNGTRMFYKSALESFDSDLSSLTDGTVMFSKCTSLTSFNSNLSKLSDGWEMFQGCSNLTSFDSDLPSLTDGHDMFSYCSALTTFNGDLSSLTSGEDMFGDCSNLTSFNSNLSSLTNGEWMFRDCKLDADSLKNIIHTINDLSDDTNDGNYNWGKIYITLGYTNTDDSKLAIANHCCCDTWAELNQDFTNKGWTVSWQFNGSQSASNVLNLLEDNETPSTIIWAKLEEVTDENAHYDYVIEDDTTKHFNIYWYHESNGNNEGYQQFGSLLEACGYFGVIPKEYVENQ